MVLGTPVMNDGGNAEIARRHGVAVVSVVYRNAPEHPHPAGIDDAHRVTRRLLHGTDELGTSDLLLGGESAGAYLRGDDAAPPPGRGRRPAARARGEALVRAVRLGTVRPTRRALLDAGDPSFFRSCYLPDRSDDECRDPSVSPLFADLHDLVPAFVSVGTEDHLLDDSLGLAARWAAAGNDLDLFVLPGLPHSFEMFDCGITRACAAAEAAWFDARLATVAHAHG